MQIDNAVSINYGRPVSYGPTFMFTTVTYGQTQQCSFNTWIIALNITNRTVYVLIPGPRDRVGGKYFEFGYVVGAKIPYGYSRRVSLFKTEIVTQRMALDAAVKYVTEHQSSLEDVQTNINAIKEIKEFIKDL